MGRGRKRPKAAEPQVKLQRRKGAAGMSTRGNLVLGEVFELFWRSSSAFWPFSHTGSRSVPFRFGWAQGWQRTAQVCIADEE